MRCLPVLILALLTMYGQAGEVPAAVASAPADAPPPPEFQDDDCAEMCAEEEDSIPAESCITRCRTFTDTHPAPVDGMEDFVHGETHNQGPGEGEAMEQAFEEKYDREIEDCKPEYDDDPPFDMVDTDGNGEISADEMIALGSLMCVDEMTAMDIFSAADKNRDKVLTPDEWEAGGEDTEFEEAVDEVVDGNTPATDGHDEVDMEQPTFEQLDFNEDGFLDQDEVVQVVMHEFEARAPEATEAELAEFEQTIKGDVAEKFAKFDADGDGKINKEEYETAMAEEAEDSDVGDEMQEQIMPSFDELDVDKDGYLTEDEIMETLTKKYAEENPDATEDEVAEYATQMKEEIPFHIQAVDTDADGKVSQAEWDAAAESATSGDMADKVEDAAEVPEEVPEEEFKIAEAPSPAASPTAFYKSRMLRANKRLQRSKKASAMAKRLFAQQLRAQRARALRRGLRVRRHSRHAPTEQQKSHAHINAHKKVVTQAQKSLARKKAAFEAAVRIFMAHQAAKRRHRGHRRVRAESHVEAAKNPLHHLLRSRAAKRGHRSLRELFRAHAAKPTHRGRRSVAKNIWKLRRA